MTASTAGTELLWVMTVFFFFFFWPGVELLGCAQIACSESQRCSDRGGRPISWRSRNLRIYSEVLRQEVRNGSLILSHIPGSCDASEAGTKSLPAARLRKLSDGKGLIVVEPGAGSGGPCSVVAVRKLQTAILALTLATAAGQPVEHRDKGSMKLYALMFLVACTASVLSEAESS